MIPTILLACSVHWTEPMNGPGHVTDSGEDLSEVQTDNATTADTDTGTAASETDSASPGTEETGEEESPGETGLGPKDCSRGTGTGANNQCYDTDSAFLSDVQASIHQVLADRPDLYYHDGVSNMLIDTQAYRLEVVNELRRRDLCAIEDWNASDHIAVKWNNDFAESYDIISSDGYARTSANIFTATCAPAWF